MRTNTSFDEYESMLYFPTLDGLRALSILLVVSLHSTDPLWAHLHGAVGVTIFFVISGFLITTLLSREEQRSGQARNVIGISGGAPENETLLGVLARSDGGALICDTNLAVVHLRAPRAEGTREDEQGALRSLARSRTYILRHALDQVGRLLLLVRAIVVGDRQLPGVAFTILVGRRRRTLRDVWAVALGTLDGWRLPLIEML